MSSLKSSYRLGLHFTDAWSIDIADEVEYIEPYGVPPEPLSFPVTVTLGSYGPYVNIGMYLALPYTPNRLAASDTIAWEDLNDDMPIGSLDSGTRIIVAISLWYNATVVIESLLPIKSLEFDGKVFSREDYPNDFYDTATVSGYYRIESVVGFSNTGHPLHGLRYAQGVNEPSEPGTVLNLIITV